MITSKKSLRDAFPIALITISVMLNFSASAQESRFLINQLPRQSHLNVSLGQSQQEYTNTQFATPTPNNNVNAKSTNLNLEFTRMTSSNFEYQVGTVLKSRKFSYQSVTPWAAELEVSNHQAEATGFESLNLGVRQGAHYDSYSLSYGLQGRLSPGKRVEPREATDDSWLYEQETNKGNNFLGYHQLSGFVGTESYIDSMAVSVTGSLSRSFLVSGDDGRGTAMDHTEVLGVQAVMEFPVAKSVNFGLTAGFGQALKKLTLDQIFSQERSARIFGRYQMDKQSNISLEYNSKNQVYPYELTETNVNLGISRLL